MLVTEKVKRGSDRRAVSVVILLGLVVIAASVYVGEYQSREHGFDWELAAIVCTGLGTTFLAVATGALAYSTRIDVRATTDLAQTTREQYVASDRPDVLLTRRPAYSGASQVEGSLAADLYNAGLGPALNVRLRGTYASDDDWQPSIDDATVPFIAPGTGVTAQLVVRTPQPHPGGGIRDAFTVEGTYLNRSRTTEYPLIKFE